MTSRTLKSTMTTALVVSVVALGAAGTALAQSNGNGTGGRGGGTSHSAGGDRGGSERVIVCTGCANPNAYIEDGVLKSGGGHGGGGAVAPATHASRYPGNNRRPRPMRVHRANEACHLKNELLPDGRMVVYRDCGEVVRPYR